MWRHLDRTIEHNASGLSYKYSSTPAWIKHCNLQPLRDILLSSFPLDSSTSTIMMSLRLALIASLLGFTFSQTGSPTPAPWSGCVDPNNPDKPEIIKIGSPHTICLTLGPGGNWAAGVKYGRYTFRPKADQYSRFHIPKCKWNVIMSSHE